MSSPTSRRKVAIVGGAGHVGLPLGLALARHHDVHAYDVDRAAVARIKRGEVPFREEGATEELAEVLGKGFEITDEPAVIRDCDFVVLVIGTPVDEHLNPDFTLFHEVLGQLGSSLRDGQTLVLRSTVYPGTSHKVQELLRARGLDVEVVFCPERVAEGYALREIQNLPQIVSAFSPRGLERARELFGPIGAELVELSPAEAELAKLFTNAWRYISFAVANQFYMVAADHQLDYGRILHAMKHNYPRAAALPGPGFAAGPCLFKDTMQLSAFNQNQFFLGHSAMLVNEGMPRYVVGRMKQQFPDLAKKTVGILGMAFKGESDDPRESLSYKLKKILTVEAGAVLTTDPYVKDPDLQPLEDVIARADVLVVGATHRAYAKLDARGKPVFNLFASKG